MTVNLTVSLGRKWTREVLNQSLAQFTIDKTVVKVSRADRDRRREITASRAGAECHLGDLMKYAALREEISQLENISAAAHRVRRADDIAEAISKFISGDVIWVSRQDWCVALVIGRKQSRDGVPRVQVIAADHTVLRLRSHDLPGAPTPVFRIRIPRRFSVQDHKACREPLAGLSARLEFIDPETPVFELIPTDKGQAERVAELGCRMKRYPYHGREDRELYAVTAVCAIRLEREVTRREAELTGRANSLVVQFDRVCGALSDLGCLYGDELSDAGRMLRRIYNELDLTAAECIRRDVFADLDGPQLTAVLSSLLYESQPGRDRRYPRISDAAGEAAQSALRTVWREIGALECNRRRDRGREPDIGFAEAAWRWVSSQELAKVLRISGLSAGDFVRWVRQVADLAGQTATAAGPGNLCRTCREAIVAMRRGVVETDIEED